MRLDHRRRQILVTTSVTHRATFLFLAHFYTPQQEIFLLICQQKSMLIQDKMYWNEMQTRQNYNIFIISYYFTSVTISFKVVT